MEEGCVAQVLESEVSRFVIDEIKDPTRLFNFIKRNTYLIHASAPVSLFLAKHMNSFVSSPDLDQELYGSLYSNPLTKKDFLLSIGQALASNPDALLSFFSKLEPIPDLSVIDKKSRDYLILSSDLRLCSSSVPSIDDDSLILYLKKNRFDPIRVYEILKSETLSSISKRTKEYEDIVAPIIYASVQSDPSILMDEKISCLLMSWNKLKVFEVVDSLKGPDAETTREGIVSTLLKTNGREFVKLKYASDEDTKQRSADDILLAIEKREIKIEDLLYFSCFHKIKDAVIRSLIKRGAKPTDLAPVLLTQEEFLGFLSISDLVLNIDNLKFNAILSKKDSIALKVEFLSSPDLFVNSGTAMSMIFGNCKFSELELMKLAKDIEFWDNQEFVSSLTKKALKEIVGSASTEVASMALRRLIEIGVSGPDLDKILSKAKNRHKLLLSQDNILLNDTQAMSILKSMKPSAIKSGALLDLARLACQSELSDHTVDSIRRTMIEYGCFRGEFRQKFPVLNKDKAKSLFDAEIKIRSPIGILEDPCFGGILSGDVVLSILESCAKTSGLVSVAIASKRIPGEDILRWVDSVQEIDEISTKALVCLASNGIANEVIKKTRRITISEMGDISNVDDGLFGLMVEKMPSSDAIKLIRSNLDNNKLSILKEKSSILFCVHKIDSSSVCNPLELIEAMRSKGIVKRKEEMSITAIASRIIGESELSSVIEFIELSYLLNIEVHSVLLKSSRFGEIIRGLNNVTKGKIVSAFNSYGVSSDEEISTLITNRDSIGRTRFAGLLESNERALSVFIDRKDIDKKEKEEIIKGFGSMLIDTNENSDPISLIRRAAMVPEDAKNEFIESLIDSNLDHDTVIELLNFSDIIGLGAERMGAIVSGLSSLNRKKVAKSLLSKGEIDKINQLGNKTKSLILSDLIDNFVDEIDYRITKPLFLLIEGEYDYRAGFLARAGINSIKEILHLNNLKQADLDVIANRLIQVDAVDASIYESNKHNVGYIVNAVIEKGFFELSESPSDDESETFSVSVFGQEILTFKFSGRLLQTSPVIKLMEISKSAFLLIKTRLNEIRSLSAKKIMGSYDIRNSKFIPNSGNAEIKIGSVGSVFSNSPSIVDGLRDYTRIKKIPASAIRRVVNSEAIYNVILDLSSLGIKKKKDHLYDELRKKRSDIQADLNKLIRISPSRKFGFELEISADKPKKVVASTIRTVSDFKVRVDNDYKKSNGRSWDVKYDQSVVPVDDGFSMEIASPILVGKEGIEEAKRVLDKLFSSFEVSSGEAVNGGLHVHHDVSDIITKSAKL